jgi:RNA polymerase sigma-70 factor (ECF subfamily)
MQTTELNAWLARWRAGDLTARDELLHAAYPRLEFLARRMLHGFPNLRPMNDTQDVLQNAALRLERSLRQVDPPPATTRAFFGLAALEIRRALLDLARSHGVRLHAELPRPEEIADQRISVDDLERWTAFHEAVERLPATEREVVGLVFYHGWTQKQTAELFDVSERTVARWWHSACLQLQRLLDGKLPGG